MSRARRFLLLHEMRARPCAVPRRERPCAYSAKEPTAASMCVRARLRQQPRAAAAHHAAELLPADVSRSAACEADAPAVPVF